MKGDDSDENKDGAEVKDVCCAAALSRRQILLGDFIDLQNFGIKRVKKF